MARIIINKNILHGKPVIEGTRIPVNIIIGSLAGGMSYDEICQDYDITKDDILACLEYAAKTVSQEETYDIAIQE
jgi:uncharacterized protein (DUF433 family)